MPRLCLLTTSPMSLDVLNRGMLEAIRERGYDITGLSGPEPAVSVANVRERGFKVVTIPFEREPSPLKDLWCLLRLWWMMVVHRFDVIHCSTPKAMLLGTLAARLSFHLNVVTVFRGRAYENSTGFKRKCYILLDKLVARLSSRVVVVSKSLRRAMLADGIGDERRLVVIGDGASRGIDSEIYYPGVISQDLVARFREKYGLGDDPIALFVGRVRQDKGVNEMVSAFLMLSKQHQHWRLVIAGPEESVGVIQPEIVKAIDEHPRIHAIGSIADPREAYAAASFLVLPTYREGFPNVPLEAAAMGLAVITTDAIGAVDSVLHEQTGLIVSAQKVEPLAEAMGRLMADDEERNAMGQAGMAWVKTAFDPKRIQEGMIQILDEMVTR